MPYAAARYFRTASRGSMGEEHETRVLVQIQAAEWSGLSNAADSGTPVNSASTVLIADRQGRVPQAVRGLRAKPGEL